MHEISRCEPALGDTNHPVACVVTVQDEKLDETSANNGHDKKIFFGNFTPQSQSVVTATASSILRAVRSRSNTHLLCFVALTDESMRTTQIGVFIGC